MVRRIARKFIANEPALYRFKRLAGKHYLRQPGKKTIIVYPGDVILAPQGTYTGHQWECLGPEKPELVQSKEIKQTESKLYKERRGDGWYIVNSETNKDLNDSPLTEEEADLLVNSTVEDIQAVE